MFASDMIAGFECGLVHGGTHDLLRTTGHVPEAHMADHYQIVKQHKMLTARDGLVPGHDLRARMQVAKNAGVQVIWDLCHYHAGFDPVRHACEVIGAARKINGTETLWVCPMNEPRIVPMVVPGYSEEEAGSTGLKMLHVLRQNHPDVKAVSVDAINYVDGPQWDSTDSMVQWGKVEVVGLNLYPHELQDSISNLLMAAWDRYGLPVMISETSWHDGWHNGHPHWPNINNKHDWLRHVLHQVQLAKDLGANVVGTCWYPIIDCPPWDNPEGPRYSHGLIKPDQPLDPSLSHGLLTA